MTFQKIFFILLIGEFVKNVIPVFNPLLTYTIRFHKLTFFPNMSGNYTIDQYRDKQFVNGHFKIDSKEFMNKAIVTFYRCNPEGANCEYFQSWTMADLCKKLNENNQVWSRWVESLDPPISCPIDKVYYKAINATVDIGISLALYPEAIDYRWKVAVNAYSDNTFIGGFLTEFSYFGYRKRIKPLLKTKY